MSGIIGALNLMGEGNDGPDGGGDTALADRDGIPLCSSYIQKVESFCGRYSLFIDGRLYNAKTLHRDLTPNSTDSYNGKSNAAIFLSCVQRYGMPAAMSYMSGKFAFALWDRHKRMLTLGRDRMGEKPLYYGWFGDRFTFASELRALHRLCRSPLDIDRGALMLLLRHTYIPAPYSIYHGVYKLPPATLLTVTMAAPQLRPAPVPYWSLAQVARVGAARQFSGTDEEAAEELERLIRDAVRCRAADTVAGVFLSGGVDSSLVAALIQESAAAPVPTFTVGFNPPSLDEAPYARSVARHLGTDHHEIYVGDEQILSVIPDLAVTYDEPFADSSQIPSLIVARLARQTTSVMLGGDGGDALLGEYEKFGRLRHIWDKQTRVSAPLRFVLAAVAGAFDTLAPLQGARLLAPVVDRFEIIDLGRDPLRDFISIMMASSFERMVLDVISVWQRPTWVVQGNLEPTTEWTGLLPPEDTLHILDHVVLMDTRIDLAGILTKMEKTSASARLELHLPYLCHKAIEFAWRLPMHLKFRPGRSKWLLREIAYRFLPRDLVDRPKTGFSVCLGSVFRGGLRSWIEELLDERRLREEGYFRPAPIRRLWRQHLSGDKDWWEEQLWTVLMFQAWLENQRRGAS